MVVSFLQDGRLLNTILTAKTSQNFGDCGEQETNSPTSQ